MPNYDALTAAAAATMIQVTARTCTGTEYLLALLSRVMGRPLTEIKSLWAPQRLPITHLLGKERR